MNSSTDKATLLVAQALMLTPEEVSPDTALGATPQWDSLAHMRLILSLEEYLGRQLNPEAIISITTLSDVNNILAQT